MANYYFVDLENAHHTPERNYKDNRSSKILKPHFFVCLIPLSTVTGRKFGFSFNLTWRCILGNSRYSENNFKLSKCRTVTHARYFLFQTWFKLDLKWMKRNTDTQMHLCAILKKANTNIHGSWYESRLQSHV